MASWRSRTKSQICNYYLSDGEQNSHRGKILGTKAPSGKNLGTKAPGGKNLGTKAPGGKNLGTKAPGGKKEGNYLRFYHR